jgi:tetratricopeptide (TPR) repeat protein
MLWCCGALFGILYVYSPALHGHFVFDDLSLPFCKTVRNGPLLLWISTVRPVLMFTYWVNYRLWGLPPFSYHLLNLFIHCANTGMVYLVLKRLLEKANWKPSKTAVGAIGGALIFALHPLQTESVSYVAGRSESLMSFFLLLAYTIFLYRRKDAISWTEAILVLFLFALGVRSKENAVSLAGILVLTDLFWTVPFTWSGLRRNWRLYCLMVPGVAVAAAAVFRVLATAQTAGFAAGSFKWYQYSFTEARAIFTYLRLAVLPFGQSLDQDYPTSHTIFEFGAIWYMLALALMVVLAIRWRRRYPLFCFGLLMFLIWLAPTSSIIPIDDALVERRMYLPLLGLILIGCEAAGRLRVSRTTGMCVLASCVLAFGTLSYARNRLWGQPDKLLEMAAAHAFYNPRPLLNFTESLISQGRCDLAPAYLSRAEQRLPNNFYVDLAWGQTLACLGHFDAAITRLQTAAKILPCSRAYELLGLVYGQMGRQEDAGRMLQTAVALGPNSETAHGSLALWYEKVNNFTAAEREYRNALNLDQADLWARMGMVRVRAMAAAVRNTAY